MSQTCARNPSHDGAKVKDWVLRGLPRRPLSSQLDLQLQRCPLTTRFALASAWGRYSRAHCRPLRTTPQMKSPQRSHHVCVVGPAGWKRWPRPGAGCLAGWRAVPGAMRRALARSSRVRPGPARRTGASSRSSMSSGSADMARSDPGSGRL